MERDKNGYFENDLNIQDDMLRCIASDWLLHTHTHLQTRLRTRNASGGHRNERRTILFASSSKPYCLQKVEIKFILMLSLRSALARLCSRCIPDFPATCVDNIFAPSVTFLTIKYAFDNM